MKMKSFAMVIMSGLVAASFTYVAPAMAEDMMNTDQTTQAIAAENNVLNDHAPNMGATDNSNTNVGGTDEGSPDTATGDDDY